MSRKAVMSCQVSESARSSFRDRRHMCRPVNLSIRTITTSHRNLTFAMAEAAYQPEYVYKILSSTAAPPHPLPDQLPLSELDQLSGFIHLSTAKQVPGTLKLFFSDESKIYLLKIALSKVNDNIRWENGDGGQGTPGADGFFPHLYNYFKLGKAEVESTACCKRKDDASWDDALASLTSDSGGPWLQH
ncbi:hypothetical protein BKA70DRAFT_573658 [Coprinopsis sp. MPI-PUGE-AT-0042]|nr:hypothetical protein BKA70DRAFT_573658 [Coprinopsis sp. MPI-PUGE-AT-0042]